MEYKFLVFNNFTGGLSDVPETNNLTTYAASEGLNFDRAPDRLYGSDGASLESTTGLVVRAATMCEIGGTATSVMIGSGCIYRHNHYGTQPWTKVHDIDGSVNEYPDIKYYSDYIYYSNYTKIGRYGPISATASFVDNWQTDITDNLKDHRPIHTQLGKIFFGSQRYVSSYDGTTFDKTDLTLPPDFKAIQMAEYPGDYVAVAARKIYGNQRLWGANESGVFFWDGTSATPNDYVPCVDQEIYSMINKGGTLYIASGRSVQPVTINFSYFDGRKIRQIAQIRREFDGPNYPVLYPNAMMAHGGKVYIGISNDGSAESTLKGGIYTLSSVKEGYPEVINYWIAPSLGSYDVRIPCLFKWGQIPYFSSYRPSGSSIGYIDSDATRTTSAYWESNIFDCGDPYNEKYFSDFRLNIKGVANGHTITLKYKKNYASSWTTVATATSGNVMRGKLGFNARRVQFRIELFRDTTTGSWPPPQVISFVVKYHHGRQ